ncbi:hypothetical protein HZC09_05935, partial [Candidatus Micrarchaeota archaeon]|nr:hypothetical protein [Candidatus Micrarchaeota archaeon]
KYSTIQEAKKAYDKRLSEETNRARTIQLREMKLPYLEGTPIDDAIARLEPIIKRIGANFNKSALGREDAEQIARLEALQLLNAGERDAETIVNAVITKVTKEAASYAAFRKITIPLPEER